MSFHPSMLHTSYVDLFTLDNGHLPRLYALPWIAGNALQLSAHGSGYFPHMVMTNLSDSMRCLSLGCPNTDTFHQRVWMSYEPQRLYPHLGGVYQPLIPPATELGDVCCEVVIGSDGLEDSPLTLQSLNGGVDQVDCSAVVPSTTFPPLLPAHQISNANRVESICPFTFSNYLTSFPDSNTSGRIRPDQEMQSLATEMQVRRDPVLSWIETDRSSGMRARYPTPPLSTSPSPMTSSISLSPPPCPGHPLPVEAEDNNTTQFRLPWVPTPLRARPDCAPFPDVSWGRASEVWEAMKEKEVRYKRDAKLLRRHPGLEEGVRPILLTWLMEVCGAYKLNRETYHLAVDYIDRYMSQQINITTSELQLIGVTALTIAAKAEEIYPPRLKQFAYVTDGGCSEKDILLQEVIMLNLLKWDLSPLTAHMWLSIFLQLSFYERIPACKEFIPETRLYTSQFFVQAMRLLDLCMLEMDSLAFSYRQLAAAVVYHCADMDTVCRVTGFTWDQLYPCVNWMVPFSMAAESEGLAHVQLSSGVSTGDSHTIQSYDATLSLLEKAKTLQKTQRDALLAGETLTIPGLQLTLNCLPSDSLHNDL